LGARAGAYFFLRAANGDAMGLVPAARRAIADIDSSQPLGDIQSLDQLFRDQIQGLRLSMLLFSIFGGSAALLAAIGIYGVMAFSIAQRRHEMGLRVALGATGGDVMRLIGRQALLMVALGLALGLAGSLALTGVIENALWNVEPNDPATFASVSFFLAAIAIVASYIPARRATKIDPLVALRHE
jgi:putative ABC transport system permease protein